MKYWKVLAFTFAAGVAAFYAGDFAAAAVGDYPNTFGDIVITTASTTDSAGLRVPHGTAPTSPTNGDVWTTTGGLFARINGATQGPYVTSSTGVSGPGSSTANAIALWNGTGGSALKNSNVTISVDDTVITVASDTTAAGLRIPHGAAPTSPTNGDIWSTTAGFYVRVNGSTVGPLAAGSGTGDVTSAAAIVDNTLVRGDGGVKGVQDTGITVDDSDNVVIPGTLDSDGASQTFGNGVGAQTVNIDGGAASYRKLVFMTNNVRRAEIGLSDDAESGGDAGSVFYWTIYDDSGVALGADSLQVSRTTGAVYFPLGIKLGSDTSSVWRKTVYSLTADAARAKTDTGSDMTAAADANFNVLLPFDKNDECYWNILPIPNSFDGDVDLVKIVWTMAVAAEDVTWSISAGIMDGGDVITTAQAAAVSGSAEQVEAAGDWKETVISASSLFGSSSNAGKFVRLVVKATTAAGSFTNEPQLACAIIEL